jgi:uncharacterized protein
MNTRTIDQTSAPWYREPWPWILLGLPGSVVIAGIVTLVIAIKNEDGLVAEDYYKQGLAINKVIARETNAERLGLTAQMLVAGEKLRVNLAGETTMPESIVIRFIHPTRAGQDREISVSPFAPGWYQGSMPELVAGRWRLLIEDADATWRLRSTWMTDQQSLSISAGRKP